MRQIIVALLVSLLVGTSVAFQIFTNTQGNVDYPGFTCGDSSTASTTCPISYGIYNTFVNQLDPTGSKEYQDFDSVASGSPGTVGTFDLEFPIGPVTVNIADTPGNMRYYFSPGSSGVLYGTQLDIFENPARSVVWTFTTPVLAFGFFNDDAEIGGDPDTISVQTTGAGTVGPFNLNFASTTSVLYFGAEVTSSNEGLITGFTIITTETVDSGHRWQIDNMIVLLPTIECDPGQFFNAANAQCDACPPRTFQPNPNSQATSCSACTLLGGCSACNPTNGKCTACPVPKVVNGAGTGCVNPPKNLVICSCGGSDHSYVCSDGTVKKNPNCP